jgi:hypothetical protein
MTFKTSLVMAEIKHTGVRELYILLLMFQRERCSLGNKNRILKKRNIGTSTTPRGSATLITELNTVKGIGGVYFHAVIYRGGGVNRHSTISLIIHYF